MSKKAKAKMFFLLKKVEKCPKKGDI